MNVVQSESMGIEVAGPKTGSATEAQSRHGKKALGLMSFLSQLSTAQATQCTLTAVLPSLQSNESSMESDPLARDAASDLAANDPATVNPLQPLPDPGAQAVWAQWQMSQGETPDASLPKGLETTRVAMASSAGVASAPAMTEDELRAALPADAAQASVANQPQTAAKAPLSADASLSLGIAQADSLAMKPTVSKLAHGALSGHGRPAPVVPAQAGDSSPGNAGVSLASATELMAKTLEALPAEPSADRMANAVQVQAMEIPPEIRRSVQNQRGGFESGSAIPSTVGLDMGSQANQTAMNLGISATIPVGAVPETAIATQVSVWVSQNVQSAELKLDADGQDPIEVSISMVGNEARVEFRCDTEETRELLTRATAELEALLHQDGIVLSGVSVGTSSQPGSEQTANSGQPDTQAFARFGRGESGAAAAPTASLAPRRVLTQSAVDLFV